MKSLLFATLSFMLASSLVSDQLDDLQKLASQLHAIRQESQNTRQNWQQNSQVLKLATQQTQQQTHETQRLRKKLAQDIQTLTHNLQKLDADSRQRQNHLEHQQRMLQTHLQQLLTDTRHFPPPLAKAIQAEIQRILALEKNACTLPQQLRMTEKLHATIRQDAHSLMRDSIRIPQVNAVYQVAYLGCAWAVAIAPDHSKAAIGEPTPDGWTWQDATHDLPEIRAFFQILQDTHPARLINLPLKLK